MHLPKISIIGLALTLTTGTPASIRGRSDTDPSFTSRDDGIFCAGPQPGKGCTLSQSNPCCQDSTTFMTCQQQCSCTGHGLWYCPTDQGQWVSQSCTNCFWTDGIGWGCGYI